MKMKELYQDVADMLQKKMNIQSSLTIMNVPKQKLLDRGDLVMLLDEKFEKGTRLVLEIHLPNQEHVVKTNGEIVWVKESPEDEASSLKRLFNTGIKFFDFHPLEEKRLFEFVSDLKTGER